MKPGGGMVARRWCQRCFRFTRSEMDMYGTEICAECHDGADEEDDDWC